MKLCPEEKVYLATLTDIDEEMEQRIRDHRKMREGKNFRTVEQGLALETLDLSGERACTSGVHDQSAGQRAV